MQYMYSVVSNSDYTLVYCELLNLNIASLLASSGLRRAELAWFQLSVYSTAQVS